MSGFGEKPFGLSQQRPAGFGAFGSNISDSNRPGGWTLGSGAPSSTGSFDATIRSSYETSGSPIIRSRHFLRDPVDELGGRIPTRDNYYQYARNLCH
ncbi:hypothetical protein FOXG_19724 [Fusarium oxysporum f. sp. lycopersici 4287]|uniref:Uncharacterized protein n=1 Tax=Fusarium oxysporum f. sp. lycopersici (strain 4287 / CBS 123668 / FGSC 9935 / NRRL 34936) TaxID=426428 RepID=A0A0J9V5Y7_FUSO4|nr:hypothetical protein FOXG_19302 [Fusarium oxysporum f. sp. lycopersici 4287]XP_018242693.1 hypothetical protein FOXG_19358 [Fusarium oxysporum f. sp. lycopersici 4287]XP_018244381.1 hypothetical protein FOXG_19637 [Fusarium oxysporum f. sp. lycopersici 4287]XP_018244628.1 hypothetical protein FOXG_19724 [Fusarium oxysporum f. sp. lycopersici 4287]KNB04457.1 hypothetical protein FOXG_19302 [Fusarium oxysporum f. sp. lycopersici 4287]KNB04648.1 hypothetical protein FOXG_19358 [Fusarium oxyspo